MLGKLMVLSLGSTASCNMVRDALALRRESYLSVATNYWDLCSLSLHETERFQVAILDGLSSDEELRRRAQHIRRRWPDAAILLVCNDSERLEDPLYDERVRPGIEPGKLVAVLERLTDQKRRASRIGRPAASKIEGRHCDA